MTEGVLIPVDIYLDVASNNANARSVKIHTIQQT